MSNHDARRNGRPSRKAGLLLLLSLALLPAAGAGARQRGALVPRDLGDAETAPEQAVDRLREQAARALRGIEAQMTELARVRASINAARTRYRRERSPQAEAALGKAVAEGAARTRKAAEKAADLLRQTGDALDEARRYVESQSTRVADAAREARRNVELSRAALTEIRSTVLQLRARLGRVALDPDAIDPEDLLRLEQLRTRYEETEQVARIYERSAARQERLLRQIRDAARQLADQAGAARIAAERFDSAARLAGHAGKSMLPTLESKQILYAFRQGGEIQEGLGRVLGKVGDIQPQADHFDPPGATESSDRRADTGSGGRRVQRILEWMNDIDRGDGAPVMEARQ